MVIIPIPLPQHQHTFLSETTFRPGLPWSSGVRSKWTKWNQPDLHMYTLAIGRMSGWFHFVHFDLTKTRAILVETSSLTKKCAGAEGEELVWSWQPSKRKPVHSACGTYTTVRSDAEERAAEERPAWKHKNIPAWTKNIMCLWDFGRLPSSMYVIKRTQPENKNIWPGP